jgi:LEA14-like dessication related protein
MKSGFAPFIFFIAALMGGCAVFQPGEPVDVTVAGIESLPSEGLELRMSVRLRIQNPNDQPIDYDGVSVRLLVQDKNFASGVSDQRGTIPRFGSEVVAVAVTISPLKVAWHTYELLKNEANPERLRYNLEGKINRVGFGSVPFRAEGELSMPPVSGARPDQR